MKKIISIGFTALMIISLLLFLDIVPVENVNGEINAPHDDGLGMDAVALDNIWTTEGDWLIEFGDSITHINKTILINGHIVIQTTALLTLQNVTLLMNCSYNGEYNITVEKGFGVLPGGSIIIEDLDGNPTTKNDRCNITSRTTDGDHRFGFIIENDPTQSGHIEMRNSELHECGWDYTNAVDHQDAGLWIGGDDCIVQDNEISNCHIGIMLREATNPTISGNFIHNCDSIGIYIMYTNATISSPINIGPNNSLMDNNWGIGIDGSSYINIHNNTMTDNGEPGWGGGLGIGLASSFITIQDNNISANEEYSLWISGGNNFMILRNEFNGSTNWTFIEYVDVLEIRNNYFCWGGVSPSSTYLQINYITNGIFDDNAVNYNFGIGAIFNGCEIDIINNRFVDNLGVGLGLQYGSYNSSIEGNKFTNNDDMGLHIVGNNIHIRNNELSSNGDGTPYDMMPVFQDCGLDLMNSQNIYVYDNDFIENKRTTGMDEVDGIYLLASSNIYMWNNTMYKNDYNLHCRGNVTVFDTNSTYTKSTVPFPNPYDVFLEDAYSEDSQPSPYGPNHITFLNTTFDNSSVVVADSISGDFTCKWYKNIKTIDLGGSPISGASIYINDSTGTPEPSLGQPFTTDPNGWIRLIPLTEYIQDYYAKTYCTPHDIETIEGSRGTLEHVNMWNTHDNIIILNERPAVTALRTELGSIGSVYRTNTLVIEAEGDDVEDNDDKLLTPHFEYRVNSVSPWIDESSSYFGIKIYAAIGGGEGIWKIEFIPPTTAPIDNYDFRVRFNDTSPSYSDWFEVINMVDVLNNPPYGEDMYNQTTSPGASMGSVYRGDYSWIYGDGEDIEDGDDQNFNVMGVEFQYKRPGVAWTPAHTTYWNPPTPSKDNNDWRQKFEPQKSTDVPIGVYNFRVRFQDSDSDWSEWVYKENLTVLNNEPILDDFKKESGVVYRNNIVQIYANVSDREEAEIDLEVHFYYRNSTSPTWVDLWLSSNGAWDNFKHRYYADFQPPADADLGIYEFMVTIRDHEYLSNWAAWNNKSIQTIFIEVKNNLPTADDIYSSKKVVRATGTEFIYIHVNGSDADSSEQDMTLMVEYDDGTGWKNDYIGTSTIWDDIEQYLKINFKPDKSAKLGDYYFRAKVVDKDGGISTNWIYLATPVEVQNPVPVLENIKLYNTEIYRGEILYILLNASDKIDSEDNLIIRIEYNREYTGWVQIPETAATYVGNPINNEGYWVITFATDKSTQPGNYRFRGIVENNVGGLSNNGVPTYPNPDTAEIKNNPPEANDLRADGPKVERGDTMILYANGTDYEDDPEEIEPFFEWRIEGGSWKSSYFSNKNPPATSGDSWSIVFTPPSSAELGAYDFRVWFEDSDDNRSNILMVEDMIIVTSIAIKVDNLNVPLFGYRTKTYYISANGTDPGGIEADLTAIFQYKDTTGDWISLEDPENYFSGMPQYINGYWQIAFTPPADAQLGFYSFRVQFSNITNTSEWMTKLDSFTLMNNVPTVIDMNVPPSGYRLDKFYISANGSDIDGCEDVLIPIFQYKSSSGDWTVYGDPGSYFLMEPEYTDGYWRIEFSPLSDAELGLYSFRVQFSDGYDMTEWITKENSFILMNIAPEVEGLTVPASCYRLDAIYVTANGTDTDGSEYALNPNFQYKGPQDTIWISYEDEGSYFTSPAQFIDGYWRIEFTPPIDITCGQYSFRVQFSDGVYTSQWTAKMDVLTILNKQPSVLITAPSFGEQTTFNITFTALAQDAEDSILTFQWDFGDGSSFSSEESPTHNFTVNGTYKITVKVKDSDGGSAEDNITIIIPKEVIPEEQKPSFDIMLILYIFISIIVVVLLLVFLLTRRKKKEEDSLPTSLAQAPLPEITEEPPEPVKEIKEIPPPPPPPPEEILERPEQEDQIKPIPPPPPP